MVNFIAMSIMDKNDASVLLIIMNLEIQNNQIIVLKYFMTLTQQLYNVMWEMGDYLVL